MHKILEEQLKIFSGKKVFFEPLGGNNGDVLIEMGALHFLDRLKISRVENAQEADAIFINGSGDLSYHPGSKPIEETRQVKALTGFPGKTVVLLPSSITPQNALRISPILKNRKSPTLVFARDNISFELLKNLELENVGVYCDDDMAFALLHSKWLQDIKARCTSEQILIVERFDKEGATKPPGIYKTPVFIRSMIPGFIKNRIKKNVLSTVYANTPFVEQALSKIKELVPLPESTKVKAADISLPQNFPFEEFVDNIAKSAVVVSTRLHVCILSAMLGKPVIAVQFEGGNKLAGVFNKSLKQLPGTHLWILRKN